MQNKQKEQIGPEEAKFNEWAKEQIKLGLKSINTHRNDNIKLSKEEYFAEFNSIIQSDKNGECRPITF